MRPCGRALTRSMARAASSARVLRDDLVFAEGARWHAGKLWFSDMHGCKVMALDVSTCQTEVLAEVPNRPSGLGFLPDGSLLIVSMRDRRLLRLTLDARKRGGGALTEVADLSAHASWWCNDMVVDPRSGRAYVGNFGWDIYQPGGPGKPVPAQLAMVEPGGAVRSVGDKSLIFPNGMAITPCGATLIVAETWAWRLSAFDIARDGSLGVRRTWAQLDFYPDGISCVDQEGCVWVADVHGKAARVGEGGSIAEVVLAGDGFGTYTCALGGEDGRTLFLLEARSHDPRKTRPGNARIRSVRVRVPAA